MNSDKLDFHPLGDQESVMFGFAFSLRKEIRSGVYELIIVENIWFVVGVVYNKGVNGMYRSAALYACTTWYTLKVTKEGVQKSQA